KQFLAALGFFLGMATIVLMGRTRNRMDDEDSPQIYRWLGRGRALLALAVTVLFFYLLGSVQLSRQAANAMRALSQEQFQLAYRYVYDAAPPAIMRSEVLAARLLYWPQVFLISVGALMIGV